MRPTGAVSVCAISDGGDGMVAQAGGLARAVAALSGGAMQTAIVARRAGGGFLPPSWGALWGALWSVGGDAIDSVAPGCIAIGCGARAQAAVLAAKKQRGAFAVCVQRPVFDEARFDAVVAPRHDYSESEIAAIEAAPAPKTVLTLGAVGPVDAAFVGARRAAAQERFAAFRAPRVAVLLGGENRAYAIEADAVCEQLRAVARAADARLLVTPSRRSPPGLAADSPRDAWRIALCLGRRRRKSVCRYAGGGGRLLRDRRFDQHDFGSVRRRARGVAFAVAAKKRLAGAARGAQICRISRRVGGAKTRPLVARRMAMVRIAPARRNRPRRARGVGDPPPSASARIIRWGSRRRFESSIFPLSRLRGICRRARYSPPTSDAHSRERNQ